MKGVFPIATEAYSQFIAILNITIFSYNIDVIDVRGRIQYFIISIRKCCCISDLATCISCPNSYFSQAFVSGFIIHIFDNELSSNFIIDIYGAIIVHNSVLRSLCACIFSALRFWSRESSSRNQGQHECCHGSQRYNLLRDLIQLYSLPINFTRSFACPHSGAGVAVRPSLASCGTRRPLPPCTSTTASAVAPGTGRIIPAWRYAVAVFPLPIT